MSNQNQSTSSPSDPSTSAWSSFAPPADAAPAPIAADEAADTEWRWGWSAWIGIHYGPIPVGLLIAIPILIAVRL
jgi:hypothetical protein